MLIASWTVYLAAIAFLIHVAIWRLARPANSAIVLASIFLATLAGGLLALGLLAPPAWWPAHWSSYAGTATVYFGLMAAYINTYPAMEAESPSLQMLRRLSDAADAGLSVEEMQSMIGGESLVTARIRDLLAERYAILHGDRLVLTPKGRAIASVFHAYRRLIGRRIGG